MALSPDGRTVAYVAGPTGRKRIYVRQAEGKPVAVTPDTGPSQARPVWSVDGTKLMYAQGENLVGDRCVGDMENADRECARLHHLLN